MHWLAIFIGGGLGCMSRYGITLLSLRFFTSNFPLGTFVSNMLSCIMVAGAVVYLESRMASNDLLKLFLITGFCGGFSTFSAFSLETFELIKQDFYLLALLNVFSSIAVGLFLFFFIAKNHLS